MNQGILSLYQAQHSPIHHLDPRVKVILSVLLIISNGLLPEGSWLGLALTGTFLLFVAQLSRIGIRFLFSRSMSVLPFALAAGTTLFSTAGKELASLPWPALTVTDRGVIRFGTIMLRSWISIQAAILLSATTPFPDLIHALRHLKIPAVLVSMISFMYRYLFVLTDEAHRLLRARASRSAADPAYKAGGKAYWNVRSAGNMVGQLFLRSMERSERIYQAMQMRGYQGHLLTLNPHQMKPSDWAVLLGSSIFMLGVLGLSLISYH